MLSSLFFRLAFIAESLRFIVPVKLLHHQPSFGRKRKLAVRRMKIRAVKGYQSNNYYRRGSRRA